MPFTNLIDRARLLEERAKKLQNAVAGVNTGIDQNKVDRIRGLIREGIYDEIPTGNKFERALERLLDDVYGVRPKEE